MATITINSNSPPQGFILEAQYYRFDYPSPQASDGEGAPCRAIGHPTAQVGMGVMPRAVFAWFMDFFPDTLATSVDVTIVGLFDPRIDTYDTYTAKMLRPTYSAITGGWQYVEAVVKFVELEAS